MLLEGRVAIISGTGPGLGRTVALLFAREGADLVLGGTNRQALTEVAAEVEAGRGSGSYRTGATLDHLVLVSGPREPAGTRSRRKRATRPHRTRRSTSTGNARVASRATVGGGPKPVKGLLHETWRTVWERPSTTSEIYRGRCSNEPVRLRLIGAFDRWSEEIDHMTNVGIDDHELARAHVRAPGTEAGRELING